MDFSLASEEQQLLGLQSEHLLEDHSQNGTGSNFCLEPHCSQTVSLPVEVSLTNPKTPLEMSSCKRSPRLNASVDKVFFELEANPRKKQKV